MNKSVKPDCIKCSVRDFGIFTKCSSLELDFVQSNGQSIVYPKGKFIFSEDSYPKGIFCVMQGKIKVSQMGADGREQILYLAKKGDVMGYRAILGEDKYSCSAVAMEDSTVCFIPKDVFIKLLENNAQLTFSVLKLMAVELRNAETAATDAAHRNVKQRIMLALLKLKESYGTKPDGKTIDVVVTREDIAGMAGTARETVARCLASLADQNIISLDGKNISILNVQRLIQISETD